MGEFIFTAVIVLVVCGIMFFLFLASQGSQPTWMHLDEIHNQRKKRQSAEPASTKAINDVIAERQRQQSVEGWTPDHDDEHDNGQLASAASCYALFADMQGFPVPAHWPWSESWWKQSGQRCDLVKAGALILAEIERLDRAAGGTKGS